MVYASLKLFLNPGTYSASIANINSYAFNLELFVNFGTSNATIVGMNRYQFHFGGIICTAQI